MSKIKGSRDKTSVCGIDFPFLALRTDRKETRSRIAKYLRSLRSYKSHFSEDEYTDWVKDLCRLCNSSDFFGFMTIGEVMDQKVACPDDHYFIYTSDYANPMGAFILTRDFGHWDLYRYNYKDVDNARIGTPLQRHNGLIFQKKLNRRVKKAIYCWSIVGKRLQIVKDLRVLIAKILWNSREFWMP
jgi:hypothetical protein